MGKKKVDCVVPTAINSYVTFEPSNQWCIYYDEDVRPEERINGLISECGAILDRLLGFELLRQVKANLPYRYYEALLIPIILSKETPKSKSYPLSVEWRKMKIHQLNYKYKDNQNSDKYDEELEKILRANCLKNDLLGGYFHKGSPIREPRYYFFENEDRPYIKIYYRNFKTADVDEYKAILAQVISHEYFHFIHDVIATKTFNKKRAQYREEVTEGTADFFSVKFLQTYHKPPYDKKMQERYDAWQYYFESSWPYANAYYFYFVPSKYGFDPVELGDIELFLETVRTSIRSMKDAYIVMIDPYN